MKMANGGDKYPDDITDGRNPTSGMPRKRKESEDDMPDVLVPFVSTSNPGTSNGSREGDRQSVNEASDSRKWFSMNWKSKPSNTSYKLKEIPAVTLTGCEPTDALYSMNHLNRGKCVIFNHTRYDPVQQLAPRDGSNVDVKGIQETFKQFGFTLVTYEDLKYDQIMYSLQTIANENHSYDDCLVVFVLTHGQANQLHAYDCLYKPPSLWSMFSADKCPTLAGKPKMFFIQACRGDLYDNGTDLKYIGSRTQVDGPTKNETMYRIPNQADILTVYSTAEAYKEKVDYFTLTMQYLSLGHFAWRNSRTGSVFVRTLCEVFKKHAHKKDVLSMMTYVNRDVAIAYESRSKDPTQNRKKQIPNVCHTLTREIYLSPKFQSTLV